MNKRIRFVLLISPLILSSCSLDIFGGDTHVHSLIHHKEQPATCQNSGKIEYYSCSCGKYFRDSEAKIEYFGDFIIPKKSHILTHFDRIESTCLTPGQIEYWICSECEKMFSNQIATKEVTDIVIPAKNHTYNYIPYVPSTDTSVGYEEHYECPKCNQLFVLEGSTYVETTLSDITIAAKEYFYVTFNYDNLDPVKVLEGRTVSEPNINPTKASTKEYKYTFEYWTLNGERFNFSTPINSNITLEPYFSSTPIDYKITFRCEGKQDVIVYFNCETDPSSFVEPELEERYGFDGSWSTYSLDTLENQISVANYVRKPNFLEEPVIEKSDGYTVKFKTVQNATHYEIVDDNDYRNEIILNASEADSDGYLYYTPEVVGKHNIKVIAKANDYVSSESNTYKGVEIKENFAYSPFKTVFFYDVRSNPADSTYSLIMEDGTWKYVTNTEFNTNYTRNRNGILDVTATEKIDEIIEDLKGIGCNVVNLANRFTNAESQNYWWWGSGFETSALKRTMDAAWRHGLKCYITDFTILNHSKKSDNSSTISNRMLDKEFQKAFTHPAFYGIELGDEPKPGDELTNTANCINAILSTWRSDSYLKTLPEPHFHTDLCSFNTNKDNSNPEEPYLFPTALDYQNYLESWIRQTGLNYFYFDYYTYTTYIYGQQSYLGTRYYYDSTKVIYDSVNNLRAKYKGLTVHQTIESSNHNSGRQALSYTNVFAATLLTVSEGMNGYSTFTFSPASATQANTPIDLAGNKTTTYTWLVMANKQYRYLMGLLDGYSLLSNELSTYKQRISYSDEGIGYGFGVRTSTSIFENENGEQYKMIVNYNTYKTNTVYNVTFDAGTNYYAFGYNFENNYKKVASETAIKLNNGEAILVKIK